MHLELKNRIFASRTLNLNATRVVGFDMDYTLVLYHVHKLEDLAFRFAARFLVEKGSYPEAIRDLTFDPDMMIRGLLVDRKLGNLIKINRYGYVKAALHGNHFLDRDELRTAYSGQLASPAEPRYEVINTMFSLAQCSLFCQLVDHPQVKHTPDTIYEDVSVAIDAMHKLGSLKDEIMRNPETYVRLDCQYADTLRMLKAFGKKLVLITNSEWEFTREMMSYSYDRFLPDNSDWRELFDLVIVEANKPRFFTHEQKFYEVMPDTGYLKNAPEGIQRGRVYQGGSPEPLEQLFGIRSSQFLYVGDHIFSDIYQSKKTSNWRTMLVITELDKELEAANAGGPQLEQIRALMQEKEALELDLCQYRKWLRFPDSSCLEKPDLSPEELAKEEEAIRKEIKALDERISPLITEYDSRFNPLWGELMWAGNDKSFFSMSIERHACLYTSRAANLLHYSPCHYFRPRIKEYEI